MTGNTQIKHWLQETLIHLNQSVADYINKQDIVDFYKSMCVTVTQMKIFIYKETLIKFYKQKQEEKIDHNSAISEKLVRKMKNAGN